MASQASIEKATGVAWSDWTSWLTAQGALELAHQKIAALALQRIQDLAITQHAATGKPFNDGWWAQSIAIAFEHEHGLRSSGELSTGDLAVSASKTVTGSLDETIERWLTLVGDRTEFDGVDLDGEPRVSSTEKWRYWKANLADGSAVSVDVSRKKVADGAPEKCVLAVQHSKVGTREAGEHWRAFWKTLLAEF